MFGRLLGWYTTRSFSGALAPGGILPGAKFILCPSLVMAGPPYGIGQVIIWCGLSANLECMSEMCCRRLAENTGRKKLPFWHHRTNFSACVFEAKACIDNRKKLVIHRYLLRMS